MLIHFGCFCVILPLALCHPSPKVSYNGHKVLEIFHNTEDDFKKLVDMEQKYELDFWKMPKHVNDTMNVRVGPQYLESFLRELETLKAGVSTVIEDVQELLDRNAVSRVYQKPLKRRASIRGSGMKLDNYHTHDSINHYLAFLTRQVLPNGVTASLQRLGLSVEGRSIEMIRISSPRGSKKRGIFIDGGIHAREWIAPATVVYLIEQLAYNPHNNPHITSLLSHYDVFLVPLVNPDGYEYTDIVRLWRKNRSVVSGSSCKGVDLNRNFPYHWNPAVGGSTNPCVDIYSGSHAESEPETSTIVNFLKAKGSEFDAYLTIHSYGQMWLYPWGYTSAMPADYLDLKHAAAAGAAAIQNLNSHHYDVGSSTGILYAAAGGSDDFAKGGAGIKYSYTVELGDMGQYGFQLPTSRIRPMAIEFVEGFLAFITAMQSIERTH